MIEIGPQLATVLISAITAAVTIGTILLKYEQGQAEAKRIARDLALTTEKTAEQIKSTIKNGGN